MRNKQRVKEGIFYGMMYTLIIMGIGLAFLQIFAHQVAGIFALSPEIPNSENVIWWAFPIAEGFALIVDVFIMKKINKDKVKELA